jgi:formate dehydrogenase subunit gamma
MATGNVDLNWAREHHDLWLSQYLDNESGQTAPTTAVTE